MNLLYSAIAILCNIACLAVAKELDITVIRISKILKEHTQKFMANLIFKNIL